MQSQGGLSGPRSQYRFRQIANKKWDSLTDNQKALAKKIWGVITYKWRWQIAMNIPYLIIFLLDKSVPRIHQFDMAVLAAISSKVHIPVFLSSFFGQAS